VEAERLDGDRREFAAVEADVDRVEVGVPPGSVPRVRPVNYRQFDPVEVGDGVEDGYPVARDHPLDDGDSNWAVGLEHWRRLQGSIGHGCEERPRGRVSTDTNPPKVINPPESFSLHR